MECDTIWQCEMNTAPTSFIVIVHRKKFRVETNADNPRSILVSKTKTFSYHGKLYIYIYIIYILHYIYIYYALYMLYIYNAYIYTSYMHS